MELCPKLGFSGHQRVNKSIFCQQLWYNISNGNYTIICMYCVDFIKVISKIRVLVLCLLTYILISS